MRREKRITARKDRRATLGDTNKKLKMASGANDVGRVCALPAAAGFVTSAVSTIARTQCGQRKGRARARAFGAADAAPQQASDDDDVSAANGTKRSA